MIDLARPILDTWEIKRELGHGKHGTVYMVQNIYDHSVAAVKIISLPNDEMQQYIDAEYGSDTVKIDNFVGMVAENFGNEVESMSQLNHVPYVVKLYDNQLQQTTWRDRRGNIQRGYDIIMVMEYAQPLKDFFRIRELRVIDVIDFACDIALGLAECEKRNIIHRDIKEDNLFIGQDNYGKMSDFGVASINETGLGSTAGMGTPYYMAPEVANAMGKGRVCYDNTVDIYSLGIVLYKMLNGNRFPLAGDNVDSARKALARRMNGEPLTYPRFAQNELGQVILKCCEYQPQDRFRSGDALYRALKTAKSHMSDSELNLILPYMNQQQESPPPEIQKPEYEKKEKKEKKGQKSHKTDVYNSTIDILADLTGTVAVVFRGLLNVISSRKKDEIDEKNRKRHKRNAIILISAVIAALAAVLVMLYPKTASFYSDPADNDRIHVKYLFLPDRRKADAAASYLTVDGGWLYYSNKEEDHSLYRMSIWSDKTELLCDDDCEYDIIIGDYIYFTSFDEGEQLCRIKKDGTGKEYVIPYACRDLERNRDNLTFIPVDTGIREELDISSIDK